MGNDITIKPRLNEKTGALFRKNDLAEGEDPERFYGKNDGKKIRNKLRKVLREESEESEYENDPTKKRRKKKPKSKVIMKEINPKLVKSCLANDAQMQAQKENLANIEGGGSINSTLDPNMVK